MSDHSRRNFIIRTGAAGLGLPAASLADPAAAAAPCGTAHVALSGEWQFRTDPGNSGEAAGWAQGAASQGWATVNVPHTWQTAEPNEEYLGTAWYRRTFDAPPGWGAKYVRVEFEAVYHTATVWLNGREVGRHTGKGYTAFTLDLTPALKPGAANTLVVKVDNRFSPAMLPRGDSYDWTPDGGITRPVSLLVSERVFVERVEVDAVPNLQGREARVNARALVRNAGQHAARVQALWRIVDGASGRIVAQDHNAAELMRGEWAAVVRLPQTVILNARLWHFDHPDLYRLEVTLLADGKAVDECSALFGVRKFEVRGTSFYLNGERVRLLGAERMAGSHPVYGMAEPESWLRHDHDDLKELNCVFTRVHWPQDRRILDYCDRHGILLQLEVPSWGADTFKGMDTEPSAEIMQNGLEQLREMIARDRNHPSVVVWGLCNEVGGQGEAQRKFVRRMNEEAKKLDPERLTTYASNSLQSTAERDVAGELDFISWNEYYESWYRGTPGSVSQNLAAIHKAFPSKPIVISEYGYCECTPDRLGGDAARARILREHTNACREQDYVGGLIFFCYNDYRTHMGDKGTGVMKQRVHGVVDVYGGRKPSFQELRSIASPVREVAIRREGSGFAASVTAADSIPSYALRGYKARWTIYGFGGLPMEFHEQPLADLGPGEHMGLALAGIAEKNPSRVRLEIVRPTGFSAAEVEWRG